MAEEILACLIEGCNKQFMRVVRFCVCKNASLPLSSYNKENLRTSQCLINHIYLLFLVTLPQQTEQVTPPYSRTSLT